MKQEEESRGRRRGTVFLIESRPDTLSGVQSLLTRNHFRTRTFASAEQFLAALPACRAGVVVANTRLLGMDGLTLLRRLGKRGRRPPVILLANDGDVSVAVRALRAGAYDFLQNPVVPHLLVSRIEQALARQPSA